MGEGIRVVSCHWPYFLPSAQERDGESDEQAQSGREMRVARCGDYKDACAGRTGGMLSQPWEGTGEVPKLVFQR